jgi:hypothetical protein
MKTPLVSKLTILEVVCEDGKHFIRFEDGTGALKNHPESRMGPMFFVRQSASMPIERAIALGVDIPASLEPEVGMLPLIYGGYDSQPVYDPDQKLLTPTTGWSYFLGAQVEAIEV